MTYVFFRSLLKFTTIKVGWVTFLSSHHFNRLFLLVWPDRTFKPNLNRFFDKHTTKNWNFFLILTFSLAPNLMTKNKNRQLLEFSLTTAEKYSIDLRTVPACCTNCTRCRRAATSDSWYLYIPALTIAARRAQVIKWGVSQSPSRLSTSWQPAWDK